MSSSPNSIEQLKGKKIVLVEDDQDLLGDITEILQNSGLTVTSFSDGAKAKEYLSSNKPEIVLSDIKLPGLEGTELFKITKALYPDIPFILMTGFSEIMDIKKAYELGVTEFLNKPFEEFDILSSITLALDSAKKEKNEILDFEFSKIDISEFISGSMLSIDLFVRLSNKKYLKVAKKGSKLTMDRIRNYSNRGIQYLYVHKNDFSNYIGLNVTLLKKAVTMNISKKEKLKLLNMAGLIITQDLFVNEVDKVKFHVARETVEEYLKVITESDDMFLLLESIKNHSDYLFSHSLAVALYASMLAKELGWDSKATQSKIILAGLLHDIGFKEIDKNIIYTARDKMTPEEVKIYETHPSRGREILKSMPDVHTDVVQAVLQHHENEIGTGFPAMIKKDEVHPLAKVIGVTNYFCETVLKTPYSSAQELKIALPNLMKLYQNEYDSILIAGLFKLFNLYIPKDLEKKLEGKKKTG